MGRPKKIVTETATEVTTTAEPVAPTVVVRSRDEIVKSRPKRVPIHEQRDKLSTTQKPGFVRRWVNDVVGRLEKFDRAGWVPVDRNDVDVNHGEVAGSNTHLGSGVSKDVGRTRAGDGTQAVLMEIPIELYEEDQAAKQRIVDESDRAMKKNIRDNDFYGDVTRETRVARKISADSE